MSFDVAMRQLGGETIMLTGTEMQLGRSETIADTAKVLSRYVDIIMIRTTAHARLLELAENATVPVINGLTDETHPCQLMADVMTYEEHRGSVAGRTFAWTGDGNNVLHSLLEASAQFFVRAARGGAGRQRARGKYVDWARSSGGRIEFTRTAEEAVHDADCVVTDSWVSMGQEHRARGHNVFMPYQVNAELMKHRQTGCAVHALPAGASRRGGDRRGDRRAAFGRVRRGREPAACAEGGARLVPRRLIGGGQPLSLADLNSTHCRSPSDGPLRGLRAGLAGFSGSTMRHEPKLGEFGFAGDDHVVPFEVGPLDVRGRIVQLGPMLDQILARHDYPEPVARLLAEVSVAGGGRQRDGRSTGAPAASSRSFCRTHRNGSACLTSRAATATPLDAHDRSDRQFLAANCWHCWRRRDRPNWSIRSVGAERLLYRLFDEHGVRVFEGVKVVDECSCSPEKIRGILGRFTAKEIDESIEDGRIKVSCEFCSKASSSIRRSSSRRGEPPGEIAAPDNVAEDSRYTSVETGRWGPLQDRGGPRGTLFRSRPPGRPKSHWFTLNSAFGTLGTAKTQVFPGLT